MFPPFVREGVSGWNQGKGSFCTENEVRLVEEFGPHCFTEADDDRPLFMVDYTDMDNLVSWLLTFGAKAEMLEPEQARNRIRKIAGEPKKNYRS